jgi:hypothetical protein
MQNLLGFEDCLYLFLRPKENPVQSPLSASRVNSARALVIVSPLARLPLPQDLSGFQGDRTAVAVWYHPGRIVP